MPKRVPMQTVVVMREKVQVVPPLGEPFEFTGDEIAQIDKMSPGALSEMAQVNLKAEDKKADAKKTDATL